MKQNKSYYHFQIILSVFIGFLMITGIAESEILIKGNGIEISDGDVTPATSDNTDFGYDLFAYMAYSPEHEFEIINEGVTDLNLTDTPRVTLTGTDFSLTQDAPASIAPGETIIFKVRFAASAAVVRNGSISIANDDDDENPYNFSIQGQGYSGPLMVVQGGSPQKDIENGDTTPDTSDWTDFGEVDVSAGAEESTFEIENFGSGSLSLGGSPRVQIFSGDISDFIVTLQPGAVIAGGSNDIFKIQFEPFDSGIRTAIVRIVNDDPQNSTYEFTIQGTGMDVPAVSTQAAASVGPDSAVLNGSIDDTGFPVPTAHGFVWNDTGMPTLGDTVIDLGGTDTADSFSSTLTGLDIDITYYVRAFATNSIDTVYGDETFFTTTLSGFEETDGKANGSHNTCFIESLLINNCK